MTATHAPATAKTRTLSIMVLLSFVIDGFFHAGIGNSVRRFQTGARGHRWPGNRLDQVGRAAARFLECAPDVFADHAERHELNRGQAEHHREYEQNAATE